MAIKDILPWLIARHWRDLNIGQQPPHAASDLSEREVRVDGKRASLSARTIRNLLNGHVSKPTRHTCKVLAELFRPHIPGINARWFHTSLDEFKRLVEGASADPMEGEEEPGAGVVPTDIANGGEDEALEGTYVCYRHAFSANVTNRITREVLHIFRGRDGLEFRMSYVDGTKRRSDVLLEFRGTVETVSPSIVLHGTNEGPNLQRRVRTLFACNNGHIDRPELENYKLGILSSTREDDGVPCTACTLLVKVQREVEQGDVTAFMKAATLYDTFDNTVGQDFAEQDWMTLRLFLDNRPSRSPKNPNDPIDAAMEALEGIGPREPVLRIAQDRFERTMEEVFQRALDADHIVPTFRADWSAPQREQGEEY